MDSKENPGVLNKKSTTVNQKQMKIVHRVGFLKYKNVVYWKFTNHKVVLLFTIENQNCRKGKTGKIILSI